MASECAVNLIHPVGDCIKEVVYEIPVACWLRYLRQTVRCFNERILQHLRNIRIKASESQLIRHVIDCSNCYPRCDKCNVPDGVMRTSVPGKRNYAYITVG